MTADVAQFQASNQYMPPDSVLSEHGIKPVVDYWHARCKPARLPLWSDFNFLDFDPDTISGFTVVDVVDGGKTFVVRFWGTAHVVTFGHELTGKRFPGDEHYGLMESFLAIVPTIVATKQPSVTCHSVQTSAGTELDFPVARLPFSKDGEEVAHILTVENVVGVLARMPM